MVVYSYFPPGAALSSPGLGYSKKKEQSEADSAKESS